MKNTDFEIIKHFGPSVLKTRMPEKMVDLFNKYVDKIVKDREKSKNQDHGDSLVADVTQEIKLEV